MNKSLILIPGWATDSRVWEHVISDLRDIVGWASPTTSLNWCDFLGEPDANPLPEFCESECKIILVGWSLGGLVAIQLAHEYPDKVAGVVLISSTSRMLEDDDYVGVSPVALSAMRRRFNRQPGRVIRDFFTSCCSPDHREKLVAAFCERAENIDMGQLDRGLAFLERTDLRSVLKEIESPVLVIHGEEDAIIPIESGAYLADNAPNASLRSIAGHGHALPQIVPTEIASMIRDFVHGL